MRLAALLTLFAALCFPQTQQPIYEILGRVTEPGIGPISGVTIGVTGLGAGFSSFTASTDAQGTFLLRLEKPGPYLLFPNKSGYSLPQTPTTVVLNPTQTKVPVNLELQRVGKVSGRVIDDESREPLKDFEVFLIPHADSVLRFSGNPRSEITDANGRFTFENLPPGEYLTSTRAPADQRQWALEVFKPKDADATELGYEESFWPGGTSQELALPVRLASGGFAEVGTMVARKTTLYRALLHLTGRCDAATLIEIGIYRPASPTLGHVYPFSCTTDLLLLGLDPGSYRLHLHGAGVSALAQLDVTDKNQRLNVPMRPNVVIDGEWIPPQGADRLPDTLSLATRVEVIPGKFVDGGASEHRQGNRFRVSVPPDTQIVAVRYQPGSPYASEIRYNGAVAKNGWIEVSAGVAANRLEVHLDNRPGSLSGVVTDSSRPVPGAIVTLAAEAYRGESPIGTGAALRSTADATGHFDLPGVIPGDYRVVARPTLDDPELLLNLLSNAQKITVAPSGSLSLALRITSSK